MYSMDIGRKQLSAAQAVRGRRGRGCPKLSLCRCSVLSLHFLNTLLVLCRRLISFSTTRQKQAQLGCPVLPVKKSTYGGVLVNRGAALRKYVTWPRVVSSAHQCFSPCRRRQEYTALTSDLLNLLSTYSSTSAKHKKVRNTARTLSILLNLAAWSPSLALL